MTDCKILQLAERCENMQQERDEFISALINNRNISTPVFTEIINQMSGLNMIINEITGVLKNEEKSIIHITNLHESTANSGVDINI